MNILPIVSVATMACWLLFLIIGFIWKHHIDIFNKTAEQEQAEIFWTKTLVRVLVTALLCTGLLIISSILAKPQVL